ncbi:MAG: hypothetical protein QOC77_1523 [Thermoleophilaceae bacterium]|jgi:hypothetical protein|nr:hypothetical protein [Thermoleophilaceae bacterium]
MTGVRPARTTTGRKPDGAVTFRVGVRMAPVNGGGRLTVAPGAITLDVGSVTRRLTGVREIVHTDREVTLVTARLVAPWFNTSLMVSDGRTAAQVSMPIFARGRLRAALDEAGFEVRETATWIFLAGRARAGPRPAGAQLPVPRWVLALGVVVAGAIAVLVVSHSPTFVAIAVASVLLTVVALLGSR